MDESEKFKETLFRKKEDFYSNLNMEDITDSDQSNAKKVCKEFEITHLRESHDFHLKNDTLLLADFFKSLE